MERMIDSLEVQIPQGRTLRIRNARGFGMRVTDGSLWVTEERNPEDYVLAAGDARRVTSDGLTLAYAFDAVRLEIEAPAGGAGMPVLEVGGGYNEYAAAVWMTQLDVAFRGACRWIRKRLGRSARLKNART